MQARRRGNSWSTHLTRTASALGVVALAALLSFPVPAGAQGLNLDTAVEKEVDSYDKPNPHFELECSECHEGRPDHKNDSWATVKFVNGEEGNVGLCFNCHDAAERDPHPFNIQPKTATPPIEMPDGFPVERLGENKGAVVCSTCHFVHAKTAGLKLLRGFPESSSPEDVARARFRDRRDLCRACHGEGLTAKSPHKGREAGSKSCTFCHPTEPKEGETPSFTKNIVELCDFCHAATKGGHFLLVNPFADPNLTEEIPKANVPMIEGEFTCVSCHNPHGGTGEEMFIRKEFVALALKSTRVRPHFIKSLCEACHTVRPTVAKGEPGAQPLSEIPLRSDDMNELCNRCHESGLSKANAHPLRAVPENFKARMGDKWPLGKDGGLTCMTCHTGGDSPVLDPKNPNFLRGAPYETRNTMCWECHDREEFSQLNPHQDINEGIGCEYCHATKMDIDKVLNKDIQDVKFKGDIVLLCIRCHDALAHPAQVDHTGVPRADFMAEKEITIPSDFPLDSRGRLTCATCHNPHAGGDQRGVAVGMEICGNCHPY